MRILLVEDDPMIGDSLRKGLRAEGFTVDWVRDERGAELAVETIDYALASQLIRTVAGPATGSATRRAPWPKIVLWSAARSAAFYNIIITYWLIK